MKISIICPLYNAENYIMSLHNKILEQEKPEGTEVEVSYVLTRCKDKTEEMLKNMNLQYTLIEPKDFSHSKTREMMA